MNDRTRERSFETCWPLHLVKRAVRLAKAKECVNVLAAFASGDGDGVESVKAYAQRRVRELRGEK